MSAHTHEKDIYIYIYIYIERERERERCMNKFFKAIAYIYSFQDMSA